MLGRFKKIMYMLLLSVIVGLFGGLLGVGFLKLLSAVTSVHINNPWLLYLLPAAGVASAAVYGGLMVKSVGSERLLSGIENEDAVPFNLTPAVFSGSLLSHLCGASVGREGAALQMGGGLASLIVKIFKVKGEAVSALTLCGMAALFSAAFGTPLGAVIFVFELARRKFSKLKYAPFVAISSFSAFGVAYLLGEKGEKFKISDMPKWSLQDALKILLIASAAAMLSVAFCLMLRVFNEGFKRLFKSSYLRAAVGGSVIVLLVLMLNAKDYCGSGTSMMEKIFHGEEVRYEAFVLKMLFTSLAVGAGFKGGEIVPSLYIGSAFGAVAATALGVYPPVGALVGMAAFLTGVTDCPIAAVLLIAELCGIGSFPLALLAVGCGYVFTGNISLYKRNEKFTFIKKRYLGK